MRKIVLLCPETLSHFVLVHPVYEPDNSSPRRSQVRIFPAPVRVIHPRTRWVAFHPQSQARRRVRKTPRPKQVEFQPTYCAQRGYTLAWMHLALQDYPMQQRDLPWWAATEPEMLPCINAEQIRLLESELEHQNAVAASILKPHAPKHFGRILQARDRGPSPVG